MSNTPELPDGARLGLRLRRRDPPLCLLVAAIAVYGFLLAVPLVRGIPPGAGAFAGSLLFAALTVGLIAAGAAWRMAPLEETILAASFLVAWTLADQLAAAGPHARLYGGPAANVLFLLACLFVGKILSRIVRERAMTLPVCIVAALADIFTVFWGPTGEALEKAPELVKKLSVAIPEAGSAAGPQGAAGLTHAATMGLGDFIFLALFLSLAVRFAFPVLRSAAAMLAAACLGIILALANPFGLPGMPLLPYLSIGFIAVNLREFSLSEQERRDLAIALGILVLMFALVAIALRL